MPESNSPGAAWSSSSVSSDKTIYEPPEEVWQPITVRADDRFAGPWYQLPIVEIPGDIPPDSPDSWPNQIEGEVEGAFVTPKFGRHRHAHHA